jgi:hypothetical protein
MVTRDAVPAGQRTVRIVQPYWRKSSSKLKACVMPSRSITTKLVASLRLKSLSR